MIRTEAEYQEALRRITQDQATAAAQQAALETAGLNSEQVARAMEPIRSFHAQLAEEVAWYERVRRRDFPTLTRLTDLGRMLIALRISRGMTQRQLAERLGVSEAAVSRDERNEYHGISLERAQKILDRLGESVSIQVAHRSPLSELQPEDELSAA
jgi:DNA-binding XRE family transcriptional regulator